MEPATDQTSGSGGAHAPMGADHRHRGGGAPSSAAASSSRRRRRRAADDGEDAAPPRRPPTVTAEGVRSTRSAGRRQELDLTERPRVGRHVRHRAAAASPIPYFAGECYLPFEGDNGGETATGVTADTIKVVYYLRPRRTRSSTTSPTPSKRRHQRRGHGDRGQLVDVLRDLLETYGRQSRWRSTRAPASADDETAARADAVTIAEDIQPFMVWGGPVLTEAFADELAAREIPCIGCAGGSQTDFAGPGAVHHRHRPQQRAGRGPHRRGTREAAGRPPGRVRRRPGAAGPGPGVRLPLPRVRRPRDADAQKHGRRLEEAGVRDRREHRVRPRPGPLQETAANAIAQLKEAGRHHGDVLGRPGRARRTSPRRPPPRTTSRSGS